MRGLFITFEGVEGAGKTTQLTKLAKTLRRLGLHLKTFREPGGTPIAEGIRAIFLDPALSPSPLTEALLLEAARSDLVNKEIIPALEAGAVVLCDRYTDSTLAYQGAGRGFNSSDLRVLNRVATSRLVPDMTILLDLDPLKGLSRKFASAEGVHRLEYEALEFHKRVAACFRRLARADSIRFRRFDADLPTAEISVLIEEAVLARYGRRLTKLGKGPQPRA
ncbi:MAG: dTMP kinase [Candidatus Eisenbacteria bacterium]